MPRAFVAAAALTIAATVGLWSPAAARMLETHTCAILAAELGALEPARLMFERGPAAAKSAATREQLEQVRRYIEVLGQVRFRCTGGGAFIALRDSPVDDADDAAALNAPIGTDAAGVSIPPKPEGAEVPPVKKTPPKAAAAPKPAATPKAPTSPKTPTPPKAPAPPNAKPAPVTSAPPVKPAQAAAQPAPARSPTAPRPKPDDAFRPASPAAKAE